MREVSQSVFETRNVKKQLLELDVYLLNVFGMVFTLKKKTKKENKRCCLSLHPYIIEEVSFVTSLHCTTLLMIIACIDY